MKCVRTKKKKTGNCEENRSSVECGVILAKVFVSG